MRFANAQPQFASLENPENVLDERALVGGLYADLVQFVNPHGNWPAEWALDCDGLAIKPIVRAQIRRHQRQWFEEPLGDPRIELLPGHGLDLRFKLRSPRSIRRSVRAGEHDR